MINLTIWWVSPSVRLYWHLMYTLQLQHSCNFPCKQKDNTYLVIQNPDIQSKGSNLMMVPSLYLLLLITLKACTCSTKLTFWFFSSILITFLRIFNYKVKVACRMPSIHWHSCSFAVFNSTHKLKTNYNLFFSANQLILRRFMRRTERTKNYYIFIIK